MQKLLIGVLAVTTIALGILCAVQAKALRATRQQARAVEAAVAAETDAQQAQAGRIKDLERTNERLEQQVQKFASVTTQLRTNEVRQASNLAALSERMQAVQKGGLPGASAEEDGVLGKGMGEM